MRKKPTECRSERIPRRFVFVTSPFCLPESNETKKLPKGLTQRKCCLLGEPWARASTPTLVYLKATDPDNAVIQQPQANEANIINTGHQQQIPLPQQPQQAAGNGQQAGGVAQGPVHQNGNPQAPGGQANPPANLQVQPQPRAAQVQNTASSTLNTSGNAVGLGLFSSVPADLGATAGRLDLNMPLFRSVRSTFSANLLAVIQAMPDVADDSNEEYGSPVFYPIYQAMYSQRGVEVTSAKVVDFPLCARHGYSLPLFGEPPSNGAVAPDWYWQTVPGWQYVTRWSKRPSNFTPSTQYSELMEVVTSPVTSSVYRSLKTSLPPFLTGTALAPFQRILATSMGHLHIDWSTILARLIFAMSFFVNGGWVRYPKTTALVTNISNQTARGTAAVNAIPRISFRVCSLNYYGEQIGTMESAGSLSVPVQIDWLSSNWLRWYVYAWVGVTDVIVTTNGTMNLYCPNSSASAVTTVSQTSYKMLRRPTLNELGTRPTVVYLVVCDSVLPQSVMVGSQSMVPMDYSGWSSVNGDVLSWAPMFSSQSVSSELTVHGRYIQATVDMIVRNFAAKGDVVRAVHKAAAWLSFEMQEPAFGQKGDAGANDSTVGQNWTGTSLSLTQTSMEYDNKAPDSAVWAYSVTNWRGQRPSFTITDGAGSADSVVRKTPVGYVTSMTPVTAMFQLGGLIFPTERASKVPSQDNAVHMFGRAIRVCHFITALTDFYRQFVGSLDIGQLAWIAQTMPVPWRGESANGRLVDELLAKTVDGVFDQEWVEDNLAQYAWDAASLWTQASASTGFSNSSYRVPWSRVNAVVLEYATGFGPGLRYASQLKLHESHPVKYFQFGIDWMTGVEEYAGFTSRKVVEYIAEPKHLLALSRGVDTPIDYSGLVGGPKVNLWCPAFYHYPNSIPTTGIATPFTSPATMNMWRLGKTWNVFRGEYPPITTAFGLPSCAMLPAAYNDLLREPTSYIYSNTYDPTDQTGRGSTFYISIGYTLIKNHTLSRTKELASAAAADVITADAANGFF